MLHEQLTRVLVASSLPLTLWIAEVNLDVGGLGELLVRMRHHRSITSQSATRYYEAVLQQDLLGDWVLSTAHGGLRNLLGALRHQAFPSKAAAVKGLRELDKRRLKRGYKPAKLCRATGFISE